MTIVSDATSQWKAPAKDGAILIWPEPSTLLRQTLYNHRHLASADSAHIQNLPLGQLRREQRRWIGHDDAGPLIATGHQIELYHPGVWAKDVLAGELTQKLAGQAYHFAVDTDAPKHLQLRWPGASHPITDDPNVHAANWASLLESPSPAHIADLRARFTDAARHWPAKPMLDEFFSNMRRAALESSNLTWTLTSAMHDLDWQLGLRHHSLAVSPIWTSPGYLAMAHHIMARAGEFADIYNAVLADYRRAQSIRDPGRPWPDLKTSPDSCEVPFWLDCLSTGRRSRAAAVAAAGGWAIRLSTGEQFAFDPRSEAFSAADALRRFLATHDHRLSPRALTLTAFIRLLLADQFIHGIGGGRYDHITDRVIERFFHLSAPAFSVTTATLLFPDSARSPIDLRAIETEGRRLRHAHDDRAKRQLVRQISAAPRRSEQRRELFAKLHRNLARIPESPACLAWHSRYEQARQRQLAERDLFDRELFYALQPAERLQSLISQYRELFA